MSLYETYLNNSLLPKRYYSDISLCPSNSDLKAFEDLNDIKNNIKEFIDEGKNLLICSQQVGNGKTSWATKILKSYIKSVDNIMIAGSTPALFINVTNLLNEKKLAINNPSVQTKISDIESKILSAKLVVFDDLCVKDISQYDIGNLYYWIDSRTSNMKSCIFTTNLIPQQLAGVLDSRLYSRVVNYSIIKQFKDGDHRRGVE